MKNENNSIYLKLLVNLLLFTVLILFFIFAFPKIFKFFLPFIIGRIIAAIANPLVRFLENKVKIVRRLSSFLVIILVIAIVILALYGIISFVIDQTIALIYDLPAIVELISDALEQAAEKLSQTFEIAPSDIQGAVEQFIDNIKAKIDSFLEDDRLSEATIGFTKNIAEYALMIIVVFVSAFFFIKDRETIIEKAKDLTPEPVLEKYKMIRAHFKYAVGGYFKAQFKIMFVIIIILFIGFKIIGARYSLLVAIATGLLDVLPVFGTGFILWPWTIVELILGNYLNAAILIAVYLICQIVKNVLQPKMIGDSVGLHPLTTLLLLYVGYKIGGVIGMILSIPVGVILVNLYRVGVFDNIIRGIKILINGLNKYRKF